VRRSQAKERTRLDEQVDEKTGVGLASELERRAAAAAKTVARLRATIGEVRKAERDRYQQHLSELVDSMERELEQAVQLVRASERADAKKAVERERARMEKQLAAARREAELQLAEAVEQARDDERERARIEKQVAAVRREAEVRLAEAVEKARDDERERVLTEVEEYLPRYLNPAG
jgi:exonuclease SbcC